jgi:hypothetical protein
VKEQLANGKWQLPEVLRLILHPSKRISYRGSTWMRILEKKMAIARSAVIRVNPDKVLR